MPGRNSGSAGGLLLATGVIAGTVIGAARGEPSLGFVAGLAAGVVAAIAAWLFGRRGRAG